jgi:hypothetical protein
MEEEYTDTLNIETLDEETYLEDEADSTAEAPEKDWKAEALKLQAILNRKQKQATAPKSDESKVAEAKTDTNQNAETQSIKQSDILVKVDEAILKSQGVDEEALKQIHIISKGENISLVDAKSHPLYEAYEKQKRDEKRKADAKLGASNSSGRTPKGKSIEEMSKEEHEAYWRERNGL